MKSWAGAAACAWLALAASSGRAADIAWRQSPAGACPNGQLATAQVEKLVGQRLAEIDWIDFEVDLARDAAGAYRVVLRTLAAGGAPREREITGGSCAEVTDAVSVAIALTISERDQAQAQATESSAAPVLDPAQSEPVATTEARAPAEPASLRVAIGGGALVDSSALPDAAPGFQLTGALEWKAVRAALFLGVLVPQEQRLPDGRGGTFDLVLGGAELCAKPELARWHLIACAGFEIGRMGGRGDNVADPRLGDAGWYAPRAELGVGYGFANLARVWLRGGVAVPLSRPEFLLDDTDSVHQASNMSLRGSLAFEIVL